MGYVWDVGVRGGRSALDYRAFRTPDPLSAPLDRRDHMVTVGIGGGRHLGEDVRVRDDRNHDRRQSPVPERSYSGYRFGGSVTYGY
ncbi:hypothetical protein D3C83_52820 [compost metagenome]